MSFDITDLEQRIDVSSLKPYGDHLLVEMLDRTRRASGLILPKGEKSECRYAKVLAVGSGHVNPVTGAVYPLDYRPGDAILFMEYAGVKIELQSGRYRLIRAHGVWAKLKIDFGSPDLNILSVDPVDDHVLVKFDEDEKSMSGILSLPGNMQTRYRVGEVLKSGPGVFHLKAGKRSPNAVKAGDRVITNRFSGADVIIRNGTLRLANDGEVQAVIEGKGAIDVVKGPDREADDADAVKLERESEDHLRELLPKLGGGMR